MGWVATAYGPPWGGINGTGVTATGIDLRNAPRRYIIAVDPNVIPLHSQVYVWPNPFGYKGTFAAEDTGGGIRGQHVDIYDWRGRTNQLQWGVRGVTVRVSGSGGPPPPSRKLYYNPLALAHVRPERIDMGVDYAGSGYFSAIADGEITYWNPSVWDPYGGYMEYQITQPGPLHGVYVYHAEGVRPMGRVHQRFNAGQRVAELISPQPYGTESGFSSGDNGAHTWAAKYGGGYSEGSSTRAGIAFSNLVHALGGPGGVQQANVMGSWPPWMPNGDVPQSVRDQSASGSGPGSQGNDALLAEAQQMIDAIQADAWDNWIEYGTFNMWARTYVGYRFSELAAHEIESINTFTRGGGR